MRMKSVLAAAALGLAAASPALAQQAGQPVTIGVSIPAATHGWAGGLNYHAKEAVDRLSKLHPNLKFVLKAASGANQQVNDLEDMVATQKINALVILPFESDPLTGPVKRVKDSGAFVTVVDRGLSQPGIEDLYVAGNNSELGRVSAKYMRERLKDTGNIVVLRGIPTTIDNERVDAFMNEIKGTNIKVLGMEHANWNRDRGFEVMQDFLSRFPKIDAVWAQDDDIALGVIDAVRQAKREDQLFIVGGAGMKQMIERVMNKDKLVPVDVLYPPAMIATAIAVTAQRYTGGVPIQGRYVLASPLITPENAKDFYFPNSPF